MDLRRWLMGGGTAVMLAACGDSGPGGGNPLQPPPGPPVMAAAISVVDNSFGPQTVLVSVGGTVTWTWSAANAQQHNVKFSSGPPPLPAGSATQASGAPFEVMFGQVGTYEFFCSIHLGMQGAVFVQ
jgi:plastocyanin